VFRKRKTVVNKYWRHDSVKIREHHDGQSELTAKIIELENGGWTIKHLFNPEVGYYSIVSHRYEVIEE
jgi:hypothetical protein